MFSKADTMKLWDQYSFFLYGKECMLLEDAYKIIGWKWVYKCYRDYMQRGFDDYVGEYDRIEYFTFKGFVSLISHENIFQIQERKGGRNEKNDNRKAKGKVLYFLTYYTR